VGPLTRLEYTYLLPVDVRPTLRQFLSGAWQPQEPFDDLLIIDANKMQAVYDRKIRRNAWRKAAIKKRFMTDYQLLCRDGVARSWFSVSPEWRRLLRDECQLVAGSDTLQQRFVEWYNGWTLRFMMIGRCPYKVKACRLSESILRARYRRNHFIWYNKKGQSVLTKAA
jgi:hypothetical protein